MKKDVGEYLNNVSISILANAFFGERKREFRFNEVNSKSSGQERDEAVTFKF